MIGTLIPEQIERILRDQLIGRIGCYTDNKVYVVPISYAYDGEYVYAHSTEGMKINIMRKNPNVCFEVDHIQDMANWQSIIAWGYYQELEGQDAIEGLQFLISRFMSLITSETAKPSHGYSEEFDTESKKKKTIIYRIRLMEKTGKFEKR